MWGAPRHLQVTNPVTIKPYSSRILTCKIKNHPRIPPYVWVVEPPDTTQNALRVLNQVVQFEVDKEDQLQILIANHTKDKI